MVRTVTSRDNIPELYSRSISKPSPGTGCFDRNILVLSPTPGAMLEQGSPVIEVPILSQFS
jgi:hypothetical protein